MNRDLYAIYSIWLREMLRFIRLQEPPPWIYSLALLLPGLPGHGLWIEHLHARNP